MKRVLAQALPAIRLAVLACCAAAFGGCDSTPSPSTPSPIALGSLTPPPSSPAPPSSNPTPPPSNPPVVSLAGDYAIALVAGSCDPRSRQPAPPAEYRSRTYASRVEQNGTDIRIVMTGVPRIFGVENSALWGQIQADNSVTVTGYY